MKKVWGLVWVLAFVPVAPGLAQDESGTDTADVMDAVAEDAAEGSSFFSDADYVETVAVDTGDEPADEEPAEPWRLYIGVDQVGTTLSVSGLPANAEHEFDSGMYRLRVGRRFSDNIGIELQYGIERAADAANDVATERYYGLFLVPSTQLFDAFDLEFPVGYAKSTVEGESLASLAFGVNIEVPVQYYFESLPDLRLGIGWMTYYQKHDARLYGFNLGLRFDFETGSWGNPFAGLDLWPFGDDAPQD